jgi:hypothetical protein
LADDINLAPNEKNIGKPGKKRDQAKVGISDSYYSNLYFGGILTSKQIGSLKLSIPLRMRDKTWLTGILSILRKISDFFYLVRIPILIIGTLLAIYLLLSQRTILDIIVLGIYIIFWLLELLKTKQIRGYGLVTDSKGKGLELAMVRAYSKEGKLIQTKITGPQGKFNLSLDPQEVILKIKKPGYQPRIVEFELKSIKDISNLTIRLESNQ